MKLILKMILLLIPVLLHAESARVQVFEKGQQYWDVKPGESLSYICMQLKMRSKTTLLSCQQKIFKKNPEAFIDQDLNLVVVGKRLWLPGSYRSVSKLDSKNYNIKNFNWGAIKTPK